MQFARPENANLVREALRLAGREELIGNSPECLVRAAFGKSESNQYVKKPRTRAQDRAKMGKAGSAAKKKTQKSGRNNAWQGKKTAGKKR